MLKNLCFFKSFKICSSIPDFLGLPLFIPINIYIVRLNIIMASVRNKLFIPKLSDSDRKKNLKFPSILTEELAEFIGMHIGDGHLGHRKNKGEYLFQLGGHTIEDKLYYDEFIVPLLQKLFNLRIEPRKLFGGNVYGFRIHSKAFLYFLKNNFDVPVGRNIHSIKIPDMFYQSKKLIRACLRGIIDTDFFFNYSSKNANLGAWFGSRSLVLSLRDAFEHLGFEPRIYLNKKYFDKRTKKEYTRHRINIYKNRDIDNWFINIKTHHSKIQLKYKKWKNKIKMSPVLPQS